MEMKRVEIDIPAGMVPFVMIIDEEIQLKQNAMLLYPYIRDNTISHGKAAEILGIHKLDLLTLYSQMGLAYIQESEEELEEDLRAIRKVRRTAV